MTKTTRLLIAAACLLSVAAPWGARAEHCSDVSILSRQTTHAPGEGTDVGAPALTDPGFVVCQSSAAAEPPDQNRILPLSSQVKIRYAGPVDAGQQVGASVTGLGANAEIYLTAATTGPFTWYESDWVAIDPIFFGEITATVTIGARQVSTTYRTVL